jgi:two-component sensor histidine kinase
MAAGMSKLEDFFCSATGQAVLDAFAVSAPAMLIVADCDGKIVKQSLYISTILEGEFSEKMTVRQFIERHRIEDLNGHLVAAEDTALVRALNGEQVRDHEGFITTRQGKIIPHVTNASPIQTADGEVIGAISASTDLRRQKALERDLRSAVDMTEMLYRELVHRVKNHLSIISGLLDLEARNATTTGELADRISGRVKTLAHIYDRMLQTEVGGHVPARAFIEDVVSLYRTASVLIDVTAPEHLTLSPEAAGPFGMLVNEAVANSYKHAFSDRPGRIEVRLSESASERLELKIVDNGRGWAAPPTDRPSQGLKLMRLLAQQLGGEMEISDRIGGGAQISVSLPGSLTQAPPYAARLCRPTTSS